SGNGETQPPLAGPYAELPGWGRSRHRFPVHPSRQAELRIMASILGLGAMTGLLAATTNHRGDRTRAQVGQTAKLFKNSRFVLLPTGLEIQACGFSLLLSV